MSATQIRIKDLAMPRLTEPQKRAITAAAATPTVLSVDSILDAARQRTGLRQFGPDDFIERLGVWLQAIEEDDGLGPLGRLGLYEDCVRHASNRLCIEAFLQRKPEILALPIDMPIIIAGLPRSGTTHLVNLLATDDRLRSMPLWESMEPVPAVLLTGAGDDSRRDRTAEMWGRFEALLPHMPAMHEMAPDHVHEDIELQLPDFGSYNLEWVCRARAWQRWYFEHDRAPQYQYARKVHQILLWQRPSDRWLMKSPQHMENFGPLFGTYPDATVIITHRDPVAVIQSIITMLAYGDRMRRRWIDLPSLAAYWVERIERLLRACVAERELLPARQSMDVLYHEYMANTAAVVRQIFRLANLQLTPAVEEKLNDYLVRHTRGARGQVLYDLKGDFGIDPGELRERFSFYYERFPVRPERQPGE